MRPAGEVHLAMLQAAAAVTAEYAASGRGATLREMAARACVGYQIARATVGNLKRLGKIEKTGECKVPGRNRPAHLYKPVDAKLADLATPSPRHVLDQCMSVWTR